MKPRLLLLSDLWGWENSSYLPYYLYQLQPHFEVIAYDSCLLANLPASAQTEEQRHQHFVSGGIQRAAERLCQLEKEKVQLLTFSVGGSIAWQAALNGLMASRLYAVSATRLRHEVRRPDCSIRLYYGAEDPFQPPPNWFQELKLLHTRQEGHGHRLYTHRQFCQQLCKELIRDHRLSQQAKRSHGVH